MEKDYLLNGDDIICFTCAEINPLCLSCTNTGICLKYLECLEGQFLMLS